MSPKASPAVVITSGETGVVPGYPALSKEALGALKYVWRLAHIQDDWTKGGRVSEAWDRWSAWPYMAKFTYGLTYAVRLLAKISQEMPAWREVCAESAALITDRMRHYAAWYDWVEQKGLDPNRMNYPFLYYKHTIPRGYAGVYNAPGYAGNGMATAMDGLFQSFLWGPAEAKTEHPYFCQHSPGVGRKYNPDPVYANGSSNMMYKGYYLEQLAHNKAISGDARWDEPFELIYDDTIRYTYSAAQIAEVLCTQHRAPFDENGSALRFGIDCEVGKAFPICIAVGGLGALLYDRLHGTDYVGGFLEWLEFGKQWIAGGSDPDGFFEWCVPYYDRDLNYPMNLPEQQIPIFWTGIAHQLSAFDRPYAERIYESAIHRYGRVDEEGGLTIGAPKELVGPMLLDDTWGTAAAVACAHEFGDTDRLEKFMIHVNGRYEPTHHDGDFYYQFGLGEAWPRAIVNHWLAYSHVGGPGSDRRMYQEPNLRKFDQPTVCGVDYPNVAVRQAIYDEAKGALIVGITPGHDAAPTGSSTSFRVCKLTGTTPTVSQDGVECTSWKNLGPGEIEVTTTVGDHSFLIS